MSGQGLFTCRELRGFSLSLLHIQNESGTNPSSYPLVVWDYLHGDGEGRGMKLTISDYSVATKMYGDLHPRP
jgi:hypothetical protein